MTISLAGRDLISIEDLSKREIEHILDVASELRSAPAVPQLRKQTILASCFFEPSTRTRLSFEAAMHRLGGSVIGFSDAASTSAAKGETLSDSMRVISAYCDIVVIRHPVKGSARVAADACDKPVINAGDGANQHPTQTLVDLFTIQQCQPSIDGLSIAIAGDLKHGRTVHSLILALLHYSPRLYFISSEAFQLPPALIHQLKEQGISFSTHTDIDEVLPHVDILYMTRLQKERLSAGDPSHYSSILTAPQLAHAKPNLRILHPLPRVDEIDPAVDKTPHAYYFQQAENGLYVRMALLRCLI